MRPLAFYARELMALAGIAAWVWLLILWVMPS